MFVDVFVFEVVAALALVTVAASVLALMTSEKQQVVIAEVVTAELGPNQ